MEAEIISKEGRKSQVHYVKDKETGELSDFKFKQSSTDKIGKYEKTREGGRRDSKSKRQENKKQQEEQRNNLRNK